MSDALRFPSTALRGGAAAVLAFGLQLAAVGAGAQPAQPTAAPEQQTFPTPEAAGRALVEALGKAGDEGAMTALFGPELDQLKGSTDPIEWKEDRAELHRAAKESLVVRQDADDLAVLVLGAKAWPFPVPLVQENGAWHFDTEAGVEEVLNRQIGEHELEAIALLRAYVDAQVEYASEDRDGDRVLEYAQRLLSPTGTRDGLFWPDDGGEPSPFGEFVARASAAPYAGSAKLGDPYRGYYFYVLTKQGPNPPGGAYSYVINGNMIAGFAMLAFPAEYGKSGVMSFLVSHQGEVYEKDLGEKTRELTKAIQAYDPDASWQPVGEADAEVAEAE
jgi:hypothetical protein